MKRASPARSTAPDEKKVKFAPLVVPEKVPCTDVAPVIIAETKKTFTLKCLSPHHYHLRDGNFVVVSDFAGVVRVHFRKYTVNTTGEYTPSKKGITVTSFIWQNLCKFFEPDDFGDELSSLPKITVLHDSLLLSCIVEEVTDTAYVTMQRYFVKRDMSRDFAPGVCVISLAEWECLKSVQEDESKSVYSVLFGKTFRAKVLGEIKRQNPPSVNDDSLTPSDAEMVLTTSLVEVLKSYVEEGIQKILDCDGCNRNLGNQLGYDCIYMSFDLRIKGMVNLVFVILILMNLPAILLNKILEFVTTLVGTLLIS
ncbi:hypothetical protein AVEN_250305-1 [Araneus ventricosus]|uniref:Transcriptional coactivator p15 (PC4) C-terminal domain-containing protein n=1 Tax=Araneus ventricosus TaxID=182803 RepID=A0A4Y2FIA4_ARAVE|nr:hypothetical protein AVEN_250305-1 [Araneus ventricosus]